MTQRTSRLGDLSGRRVLVMPVDDSAASGAAGIAERIYALAFRASRARHLVLLRVVGVFQTFFQCRPSWGESALARLRGQ